MTTADELRARLEADLRTAHALRNAERPDGLTASSVGGCSQYAARSLLNMPESGSADFWRGLRGHYVHDGLGDDLKLVDPDFVDGRDERYTWDPGGGFPVITGAYDFALGTVMCEAKSRPRDECRWHADHGPDPQHAIQVAQAAVARKYPEAAVIYVPTDAGWEEAAVCMVDVRAAITDAVMWLDRVDVRHDYQQLVARGVPADRARERVLADIPREPNVEWCKLFCGHFKDCRGDYIPPATLEIEDPVIRAAAQEAEHWRQVRLNATKKEEAAKIRLAERRGIVSLPGGERLVVEQNERKAGPSRRASRTPKVTRRPAEKH